MNVAMIMSGGVGKRFGSSIPKQYNLVNGKPVIDYVIEVCQESQLTNKIVVVCDPQCVQFSELLMNGDVDIAQNGSERCYSLENGLKYIQENYNCDNICILDAVAPFVYPELIDDYFRKLKDYDCVITCQKITGELGDYDYSILKRDNYYISQSPEAFRFGLLIDRFDPEFDSSELANQLPKNAKRYLNFDFKNNLKLTYDFELKYVETMIGYFREQNSHIRRIYEKEDFLTEGINAYLMRVRPQKTNSWLCCIADSFSRIATKWEITSFVANQNSRFGLVLLADSKKYGPVVLKFIPPFISRYEQEKEFYNIYSDTYMCKLIDCDDDINALMLQQIKPGKYGKFEDNIAITKFWANVFANTRLIEGSSIFNDYYSELKDKAQSTDTLPFMKEEIESDILTAVSLYDKHFAHKVMYLIHGDLHEYNIIKNVDSYAAVDPIGFAAPLAFEATRFIRNDLMKNKSFGVKERCDLLLNYFSKWISADELRIALYIDIAFTAYNSVFENKTDLQTKEMVNILNVIIKDIL